MKFIWIDKEKYLDQLSALKGNYEATDESIDPDVIIYRIKKEKETIQAFPMLNGGNIIM